MRASVWALLLAMISSPVLKAQDSKDVPIPAAVAQGMLISKVAPIYPPIAKAAHISGKVVLRAVISKAGRIEDLRVVSGPDLLKQAALDAVKQWRYKPYLLNGEEIGVETAIEVVFELDGPAGAKDSRAEQAPSGIANTVPECTDATQTSSHNTEGAPFGCLEEAVVDGGLVNVRGWAADSGHGTVAVTVEVDGRKFITVLAREERWDLAQARGNQCLNSGWTLTTSAKNFKPGWHTITAEAEFYSTVETTAELTNQKRIYIPQEASSDTVPAVSEDAKAKICSNCFSEINQAVVRGGSLYVRGWAAHSIASDNVVKIEIQIDGHAVGTVTPEDARDDVAAAKGQDLVNSGWHLSIPVNGLRAGHHEIEAKTTWYHAGVIAATDTAIEIFTVP